MDESDEEWSAPVHPEPPRVPRAEQAKTGLQQDMAAPLSHNVKEKLILLIDTSYDMSLPFPAGQTRARVSTRLQYVKKAVDVFLHSKSLMNPSHEFALLVLQDDVVICYQEFTRNIQLLLDIIYDLEPMETQHDNKEFSLDPILDQVASLCQLPVAKEVHRGIPSHVVRAVLIFGRSNCELTASESMQQMYDHLQQSPYFFFDVVYIFDANEESSPVQANCDFLADMNADDRYYNFQVSSKATEMFESLAKLMAHPLQRCRQHKTDYSFVPVYEEDPAITNTTVC